MQQTERQKNNEQLSEDEIELDCTKSVWKNLEDLYQQLKKLEEKKNKIESEIKKTQEEINALKEGHKQQQLIEKIDKKDKKKVWYENYLWFYTTNQFLVIAGKNAKQNDEIYSKYLKPKDLFFHADIIGAPATILKSGELATEQDIKEAAQWAASYSSAWKKRLANIDVYYVKSDQVSKYSQGQYVGKGAFLILGKRNWLKNVELSLKILKDQEKQEILIVPKNSTKSSNTVVYLYPGEIEKEKAIQIIAQRLKVKKEKINMLPAGGFEIR
ncbi:MAG: NFACT RNA binding domain-containing protein [Candidatus Anstonellaceae archaeon]